MDPEQLRICVGCDFGTESGFGVADIIAIAGVIAGGVGAVAGIQAFVIADRALRSGILREEFAGHRQKVEASLTVIERSVASLRQSAHLNMPLTRFETNFDGAFAVTTRAVEELVDEAQRIDQRGLFTGAWNTRLAASARTVEREWQSLFDRTIPAGIRRASGKAIVDALSLIVTDTRQLIEDTVKAPLRKGLFQRRA